MTPMFLACSARLCWTLATCRQSREGTGRCLAFKTMIFVLSPFNSKLLCSIHASTLLIHVSNFSLVCSRSAGSETLNASSTHWRKEILWWCIMSPSGAVYSEYRSETQHGPLGDAANGWLVDRSLPIEKNCFLSARYDVNHCHARPCPESQSGCEACRGGSVLYQTQQTGRARSHPYPHQ